MEAQLDQITQPVAFAALPLSGEPELEETNTGSQYTRSSTSTIKGKGKERSEPRVIPLDFDGDGQCALTTERLKWCCLGDLLFG